MVLMRAQYQPAGSSRQSVTFLANNSSHPIIHGVALFLNFPTEIKNQMNNFGQLIVDSIGLNRNAICSGDCAIKCNIVSVVLLVLSIPDTCQFFCNYRHQTPKMYLRAQVPVITCCATNQTKRNELSALPHTLAQM